MQGLARCFTFTCHLGIVLSTACKVSVMTECTDEEMDAKAELPGQGSL